MMERAAALAGRGWRDEDICRELGCGAKQLARWRGRAEFRRKCDEAYRAEMRRLHYRTVEVLGRQLEGDEAKLAQSAATALVKLAGEMEQDDAEFNVYFDRMPPPGQPEQEEETR